MKWLYLKTAVLTFLIFSAGLIFGLWVGQEKVSELEATTLSLKDSIETAELQFALLEILEPDVACTYLSKTANELGKQSETLAREVERFESTQKLSNSGFISLKKEYTNVMIKNWISIEKIKETCDSDYITVLYFYSNENCAKCLEQGIALTYMKDVLKNNLKIFALDTDLQVSTVDALKDSYKIESYPAVVIEKEVYSGFVSVEELTDILCNIEKNLEIC